MVSCLAFLDLPLDWRLIPYFRKEPCALGFTPKTSAGEHGDTLLLPFRSPVTSRCDLPATEHLQEDAQVFITPSLLTVRSRQVFFKAWWEMITRSVLGKSLSGRQTQNLHSVAWQKEKRKWKLKKRVSEDMRKNIFTMKAAKNWNRLLRSCAVPILAIFQDKTSCEQHDLIP